MKLLDYFREAFKNFKNKKIRTGVNMFSISIGVILIVTLVSLGSGVQLFFENKINELPNLKQITILPTTYQSKDVLKQKIDKLKTSDEIDYSSVFIPKKINSKLLTFLKNNKGLNGITIKYEESLSEINIDGEKLKDISIVSYEEKQYLPTEKDSIDKLYSEEKSKNQLNYISHGRNIQKEDKKTVLISEEMAMLLSNVSNIDTLIGKEIILKSNVAEYDLSKNYETKVKVVGLVNQRFFQPAIIVSNDIMEDVKNFYSNEKISLFDRGPDNVQISLKDVNKVSSIVSVIEKDYGYTTESVHTVAKTINKALLLLKLGLSIIGLIIICISSLDIINNMAMSVFERTRSIGLMKAVGASNNDILKMFLVEGGTIGLIGSLIGVLISLINLSLIRGFIITLSSAVSNTDGSSFSSFIKIDISIALITIFITVCLTVLVSLYPALKASRLDPIDALRHE